MITKEQWKTILETEGLTDFIKARSYTEHGEKGNVIGVYQTANEYYATIFRIFPAPYLGHETEQKIATYFNLDFPDNSVVQFITQASRNINNYIKNYEYLHNPEGKDVFAQANIGAPETLKALTKNKVKWLKSHANVSIFEKNNINFFLRDFINLCVIMIPRINTHGEIIEEKDLLNYFAKAKAGLRDFSPINFDQKDYIKFMRESLNPSLPLWNPPNDNITALNAQITDNNSAVELKDNGNIAFGTFKKDENGNEDIPSQIRDDKKSFFKTVKNKIAKLTGEGFLKEKEDESIDSKWFAGVLTTKLYPEKIDLSEMNNIIMDYFNTKPQPLISKPFVMSLTIKIEEREKLQKSVEDDAKWNLWQLSAAGGAAKFMTTLKDRAIEANNVINLIQRHGEIPMKAMWSLTVYAEDEVELENTITTVQKEFMLKNWILQKEKFIQIPVLLYSLPLQFDDIFFKWSKRFSTLFKSNNANIVPLLSDSRGFGLPVLSYTGRNGQVQGIDLFDKSATNKNFVTIAPSGSGKSYLMADFFINYLATGAKVRIIDSGESYLNICERVQGQYIRFDEESDLCLNFFTDIRTNIHDEIEAEAIEALVPIIGMMAKQDLNAIGISSEDAMMKAVLSQYISTAIKNAYKMEGNAAGMAEVVKALQNLYETEKESLDFDTEVDKVLSNLIKALMPYADPKGEAYKYFNGRKNISFDNDFVVLEMMELETKGNLRNVILLAIADIISNEFYFDDRRKKKLMAIDEAWSLLADPIVGKFIEGIYRKARKFNGSIGTITQSINDFFKNEGLSVLYENAYWKFFLEQEKDTIYRAVEDRTLVLDNFTQQLILSIRTVPGQYSEIMCRTSKGAISIGRLITDRVSHWLYTTDSDDTAIIKNVQEHFGVSQSEASIAIGQSEMNRTSIEEEIKKIKEEKELKEKVQQKEKDDDIEEILDLI